MPPFVPAWSCNLHVHRAAALKPRPRDRVILADTLGRPLVLVRGHEVIAAFALDDSDFALQPDFAAFMNEVLQWAARVVNPGG